MKGAWIAACLLALCIMVPPPAGADEAAEAIGRDNATVVSLYQQGRYAEALDKARAVLDQAERTLGPDHPDTLTSVNNLAFLYESQGRYGEAEPLYKRALEAFERVLGPEHPDTLTSVNYLAFLYQSQGRYGVSTPFEFSPEVAREFSPH